jgi:NAD(P)-dependent dehydrogenase (short-subunit alcohol dehydrogenase family)
VRAETAWSTWSAVVVGGRDTPRSPAARLAEALRRRHVAVEDVREPDPDELAAGCARAAQHAPLRAFVHAHVPASVVVPTPLVELDDSGWTRVVDESVLAMLTTLQAARRCAEPGATVLVVVPAVGLVGTAGYVASAAAGEAQRGLAKSAARAWRSAGISVNVLAAEPADLAPSDEVSVRGNTLSPRGMRDDDGHDRLVDAAMVLLSPDGASTTGVTLVADGGATMLP